MKKRRSVFSGKSCQRCGYWRNGYCNDLDVRTNEPVCSDENYYA